MKTQKTFADVWRGCFMVMLLLLAACGGDTVTNPAFQPEIKNNVDTFEFQANNVTNVTQTVQYTWQNTGTAANVNQATTLTAGTAVLTILDNSGTEVYSRSLTENGTFVTTAGTTGDWTIRVALNRMSGTINFRVEKRP